MEATTLPSSAQRAAVGATRPVYPYTSIRVISIGSDLSMLVVGTVTVTWTSFPRRDAVIVSIAAGMRTNGASGAPFLPHPHAAVAASRPMTASRRELLVILPAARRRAWPLRAT